MYSCVTDSRWSMVGLERLSHCGCWQYQVCQQKYLCFCSRHNSNVSEEVCSILEWYMPLFRSNSATTLFCSGIRAGECITWGWESNRRILFNVVLVKLFIVSVRTRQLTCFIYHLKYPTWGWRKEWRHTSSLSSLPIPRHHSYRHNGTDRFHIHGYSPTQAVCSCPCRSVAARLNWPRIFGTPPKLFCLWSDTLRHFSHFFSL